MMKLFSLLSASAALFFGGVAAKKRDVFVYLNVFWQLHANPKDPCKQVLEMADAGVSHIILTFAMGPSGGVFGMTDSAANWHWMSDAEQKSCLSELHAKGSKLILSFGGETDHGKAWLTFDPEEYAKLAVETALADNYDGLDYDLEGIDQIFPQQTRDWFVIASVKAREFFNAAGKTDALILHAPMAPYFGKTFGGPEGGFVDIATRAGDAVDYYVIQYYNQGDCHYQTFDRLFTRGEPCFSPDDAWKDIIDHINDPHIAKKLVIGKIANPDDGGGGYVVPATLGEWLCKAEKEMGYDSGIMFWSWREPNNMVQIIKDVGGESCNSDSGAPVDPTQKPTDAPVTTTKTVPATTKPTTTPAPAPAPTTTTTAGPTTTRAPVKPGDYACYQNAKGAWYPECQSADVCVLNSENEAECGKANSAETPFKIWTSSDYDCRMSTFHASFCMGLPEDPEPWTEVPAGGKGCFASSLWWDADCASDAHCIFDGGLKSEDFCVGSGKPNAVWVGSVDECRAAIKSTGCSK